MKLNIFITIPLLIIFLSLAQAKTSCYNDCYGEYCSQTPKKEVCQKNTNTLLKCIHHSCKDDNFSEACAKEQCENDIVFMDYYHCISECFDNNSESFTDVFKFQNDQSQNSENDSEDLLKIHKLSKKVDLNKQSESESEPLTSSGKHGAHSHHRHSSSNILTITIIFMYFIFAL